MKVKELIEKLQQCDPEDIIVLAKDEEGNGFNMLGDIDEAIYVPCHKETYLRELTPELEEQGYTEEDFYDGEDGQLAIVLWP